MKTFALHTKEKKIRKERTAPKMTVRKFIETLREFNRKHAEDKDAFPENERNQAYLFMRRLNREIHENPDSKIARDLKVKVNFENYDVYGDVRMTKSGIPYYILLIHGDWEEPVAVFAYFDGRTFRLYVPERGNTWRKDTRRALGNMDTAEDGAVSDREYVEKVLISQGDIEEGNIPQKLMSRIRRDYDMMADEFENRIKPAGKLHESLAEQISRCITEHLAERS